MVQDPEGPVSASAGKEGSDETARIPDASERKRVARMATHPSHLAPKSKKASANILKAERHAEQTGIVPVIKPSVDQDANTGRPSHGAHSPEAVKAAQKAVAANVVAKPEGEPNPYDPDPDETVLIEAPTVAPYPSVEERNEEEARAATDAAPATPEASDGSADPYQEAAGDGEGDGQPEGRETPEKKGRVGVIIAIVGGIAAALVAIYVGGALYFQNTFMPNTTLNGDDVSMQSKADVAARNETDLGNYRLTVTGDGLDFPITADDAGLTFDGDAYVENAIRQTEPWTWPVTIWQPRDITTDQGTKVDESKVDSVVNQRVSEFNATATPPTDASISYDDAAGAFKVNPSSTGTQVDPQAVSDEVKKAISTFQPSVEIADEALSQPALKEDDERLTSAADKANSYLDTTVTLNMNGQQATTIDGSLIKNWVVIGDDLDPTLDTNAITEWGKKDLSSQLDTISRERHYTRADGKEVTVSGGTYGWSIDSASLAPMVTDAVTSGSTAAIDVPVLQSASQPPDAGGRDWGNRYIDVDLGEQYVRMYGDDGSLIWEAPCVSGDTSLNHDTPTGVYTIDGYFNKESPSSTLIGYKPGTNEKEYESYVRYWMPFIGNSVGLHDADWRGSFGGSIYQYNGSHGCVNLPVSAAGDLCALINQGDVVVVHY